MRWKGLRLGEAGLSLEEPADRYLNAGNGMHADLSKVSNRTRTCGTCRLGTHTACLGALLVCPSEASEW